MRDPFDEIKVVVKRGEVDWVHIVPSPAWVSHKILLTKIVKLCRVGHRRNILSAILQNPCCGRARRSLFGGTSTLCTKLSDQGHIQTWIVNKWFLIIKWPTRPSMLIELQGRGVPESGRVVREDETKRLLVGFAMQLER